MDFHHQQFQSEKEKYVYDFDNMQAQLDKSQGQLSRVQKEKDNIQQEMERFRDKHDKNQVRIDSINQKLLDPTHFSFLNP